jgi:hypothetical protein
VRCRFRWKNTGCSAGAGFDKNEEEEVQQNRSIGNSISGGWKRSPIRRAGLPDQGPRSAKAGGKNPFSVTCGLATGRYNSLNAARIVQTTSGWDEASREKFWKPVVLAFDNPLSN